MAQHVCSSLCANYAISHLITFRHREFLKAGFTRLFADRILDKRIYKALPGVLKPEAKPVTNVALSQLKLGAKKRIEEILRSKLPLDCPQCHEPTVGSGVTP